VAAIELVMIVMSWILLAAMARVRLIYMAISSASMGVIFIVWI